MEFFMTFYNDEHRDDVIRKHWSQSLKVKEKGRYTSAIGVM